MSVFLKNFGIQGYRSFGEAQYISSLSKVNFFVGQNNSGKSNILRFISHLSEMGPPDGYVRRIPDDRLNRYQGEKNYQMEFMLAVNLTADSIKGFSERTLGEKNINHPYGHLLPKLLDGIKTEIGHSEWWFRYGIDDGKRLTPDSIDFISNNATKCLAYADWQRLWALLTEKTSGDLRGNWIPDVLKMLCPWRNLNLPESVEIREHRIIGQKNSSDNDYNGGGLIDKLAELQHPNHYEQQLKISFQLLNQFVQEVTENSSAKIEIPANRSTINVEIDSRLLPIESLGSGIHQVIILGAAATTISEKLVCIEEPEVHLHPRLQRKLLNYLAKNTDNQYFITTHSAHMLDTPDASVFHVRLEEGQSIVSLAHSPSEKYAICHDLGYRASDIMQTPCVIWVEGPSDRIYIRHWLQQVEPTLREELHYSIMFYGGRLLSHLTPKDPEIEDFISLRRLNRNLVIVIDSDRRQKGARINATKKRVVDEFVDSEGFAWVTEGREIENYIASSELQEGLKKIAANFKEAVGDGQYDKPLSYLSASGETVDSVDKVKLAREICSKPVSMDRFDLHRQISRLVSYIKTANHISES